MIWILLTSLIVFMATDPFTIENADAFAVKMEEYYGIHTQYEMRYLNNDWWSGTLAVGNPFICTDTVYLSTRWYGEQSPIWKYTLAHEWAHVLQGKDCVNNEKNADLIALTKLAEAGEFKAFIAGANWLMETKQLTLEEVIGTLQ